MEIVIVVAAKVAEYTVAPIGRYIVWPLVRPIARPFINLWEYDINLKNLKEEMKKLEAKREWVQGLTNVGVEPPLAVQAWQGKVTNFINEVSGLTGEDNPEQESRKCCEGCTYSNLKECYQRRNTVARKLTDVARLLEEAENSAGSWESESKLENLKKEVEELVEKLKEEEKKLVARKESVQRLIKDGEEPLQHVKLWQDKVNEIIDEISGLINPQQQNMQRRSDLNIWYQQRKDNVARMSEGVAQLLHEAGEVEKLKDDVEKLKAKRDTVKCSIKGGKQPLPDVKLWLDKVDNIINEVSGRVNSQQQNNVARTLDDVAQLLREAREVEKLKEDVEKLKAKRDSVKCSIKVGEEPLPDVKLWQDKVDNIINEVSGRVNSQQQNNVARMLDDVAQLLQEGREFTMFSYRPIPEETWLQSSEGYEAFKSRTSILKEIIQVLSKPNVGPVGIYGMGGIGKTALAKQVARQAYQDKLFNKIVFVEVSQTPDIKEVQREIGSKLGLNFCEEDGLSKRARQVYQQLKNEEKTLLILDNIWESLNFETVGIPYKHDSKGLKVLMTARNKNVLTDGIEDSQHNIGIEALEWEDAWSLFKSKAGTCVDRSDLHHIAVDVAKKCGGVPIAIVTIAKALRNKEKYEWRKVLGELGRHSSDSFGGVAANVDQCIELSYNYLETEELKATLLLCSSMGRTYDASIEDLLRYGIGLGLFNRFDTIEEERDNVFSLVSTLKASSLLADAPKRDIFFCQLSDIERFAMHDVVCDVTRSTAYKYKNVYNVIDHVIPRSWESANMQENCTFITLHDVNKFSEDLQLECPQLSFLYVKPKLSDGKTHSRISDKFFARMPKLQVLHLIGIDLQTLSTPFSDLVNLRTLCLEQCFLKDTVDIGDLENVEILSFRHCKRFKLPEKMRQLSKLRLLEFNSYELEIIPSEFILSFRKLEALYMSYPTIKWEVEKSNNGSRNASREVLEHLSNLTSLEIRVPDATMLRGLLSPKLERYNITTGNFRCLLGQLNRYIRCKTSRFLQVKLNTNEDWIISRLKPIRQLVLDEGPSIANNFCDLDGMGFPELEDLHVQNNSHILHIADTMSHDGAFPALKSLILWNLINLKTICNGSLRMKLFHQLRTIRVWECHELTNLFSFASDRVFQELEEIEVERCEKMKEIFAISEQVHKIKFSKLSILRLKSLPQLEGLCCNVKITTPVLQFTSDIKHEEIILEEERDVSKPLFNEKVEVTNLETLEINNINVKSIWDNQLPTMANIPNLTCLIISNLPNLTRLSFGDYIKFPLLKEMTIKSCPKFKEFFFDDKVGVPSLEKIKIFKMDNLEMIWHNQLVEESFPKLKSLQVEECHNLTRLSYGDYIKFPLLKEMTIGCCPKFKEVFFDDKVGVPSLQKVDIFKMENLKMIWHNQLVEDSFFKLKSLRVQACHKLLTLFHSNMCGRFLSLETLNVSKCSSLEEILDLRGINSKESHLTTSTQNRELCTYSPLVLSFANLQDLEVSECQSLKTIVAKEEVEAKEVPGTVRFVFPKLTLLGLYELPELRTFYLGRYVTEWPILKTLQMHQCQIHDTNDMEVMQELSLLPNEAVPCLKQLILSGRQLMMMWQDQDPEPLFRNFKILKVIDEYRAYDSFYKDQPILHYIGDVKYMWKQNFKLDLILPNFEKIEVRRCDSFISLMPPSASFQNLTSLEVYGCKSLEHIGTFFMANNLVKLVSLRIYRCEKIVEVLRNHEDVTGDKILSSNLERLSLVELPSLTSFCSRNFILEFPSLEELEVRQCPNMKIFSQGELTTPKLHEVKSDWRSSVKLCPDVDVNTAIQQLHEQKSKLP